MAIVRERLAVLRGTTPDAIARTTTANAIRLFRLPVEEPESEPAPNRA
jgi:Tat protein secretion system quality control protein TatD with DNase activity